MVKGQKLWTAVVARNDNVLHDLAKINTVELVFSPRPEMASAVGE